MGTPSLRQFVRSMDWDVVVCYTSTCILYTGVSCTCTCTCMSLPLFLLTGEYTHVHVLYVHVNMLHAT